MWPGGGAVGGVPGDACRHMSPDWTGPLPAMVQGSRDRVRCGVQFGGLSAHRWRRATRIHLDRGSIARGSRGLLSVVCSESAADPSC